MIYRPFFGIQTDDRRVASGEGEDVGMEARRIGRTDAYIQPVLVAEEPLTCVVRGSGKALDLIGKMNSVFVPNP